MRNKNQRFYLKIQREKRFLKSLAKTIQKFLALDRILFRFVLYGSHSGRKNEFWQTKIEVQ